MCTHLIISPKRRLTRWLFLGVASLVWVTSAADTGDSPELPALGGAAPHPANGLVYARPTALGWMTRAPQNLWQFGRELVNPDNTWPLLGLAAGTAALIKYDQPLLDASQRFAKRIGLIDPPRVSGREFYYVYSTDIEGIALPVYVPTNLNSSMYYLGDGYTQLFIVGSFFGYGMYYSDNRALQTASLTMESLLTTGIVVQILKRTTGRESPFQATVPGGRWDFFPNQKLYNYHTPKYDAFPSGHMATVMAATTVVAANYPEYRWIKPLGYTAMTLLGFAMLNNGVHWASEFPIAIALGYTAAKVTLDHVPRVVAGDTRTTQRNTWYAMPMLFPGSGGGLTLGARF
ncbi:MAG: phosphatase PAP2 family protein [Gammaproteobacteria bacterium]|nr:phosphatase PAP2 family protein [Gammaproteobacteria bacterium]